MQHRFDETASTNGHHPVGDAPAAQQRVTPEELLQALKTLESRQAQAGSAAADTIPLGEAVQELNLELTPEQVWEEVRAQRAIAVTTVNATAQAAARRSRRWILSGFLALCFLPVAMGLFVKGNTHQTPPHTVAVTKQADILLPGFSRLSEVPDGAVAFIDFATLQQVANGAPAETIHVFRDPEMAGVSQGKMAGMWRIVRVNGSYQAEVWITPQDGLKLMNRQTARVYASRPTTTDFGPIPDRSIRLPVERLLNPILLMGTGEQGETLAVDTAPLSSQ